MKKILVSLSAVAIVAAAIAGMNSGLKKGESISAFHPSHVAGPLANTDKCFPCTFQNRPQVQVWFNGDSATNIASIAKDLDKAVVTNGSKEFKALVLVLADANKVDATKAMASKMAKENNLKNVSVAVLSKDDEAIASYKFNLDKGVKNTVFVYKNWKVQDSMVNLTGDTKGLKALNGAIANVIK